MEKIDLQMADFSPQPKVDDDQSVTIYLYGGVTTESISRVISQIHNYGNSPNIQLRIKTNGGDMDEAFALCDIIREYGVNTHVDGFAFSGGFLLFLAGERRTMSVSSKLMHHEMRYQHPGSLTQQEIMTVEMRKRQNKADAIIMGNSDITRKQLDYYYTKNRDWFIEFDEALSLGILTDIQVIEEGTQLQAVEVDGMDNMEMEVPYRYVTYIPVEEYLDQCVTAKTDN